MSCGAHDRFGAVLAGVEHNGIPTLRTTRELLEWRD
jgi:hypothetical protein